MYNTLDNNLFRGASALGVAKSDGINRQVQPVKLDVEPKDVDTVLDMYYSSPDGSLPVNNGTKYLSKDTPPEVVEYIKQYVIKPLPHIAGTTPELAEEFPSGGSYDVDMLRNHLVTEIKKTFDDE